MSILGPLLLAGGIALMAYLGSKDSGPQKVLVVDETYPVFEELKSGPNIEFHYSQISLEEAEKIFPESNYTSMLVIPNNILAGRRAQLFFNKQPSSITLRSIERKLERIIEKQSLRQYNISYDDYRRVRKEIHLTSYRFDDADNAGGTEKATKVNEATSLIGFILGALIYMFIFMYGVMVMRGVMEEKSNRIVEVIISSVKPFQLLMGKVVGVALVGLTQFLIWIVLGFTMITATQSIMLGDKIASGNQIQSSVQMSQELQQSTELNAEINPMLDFSNPDHLINTINWPLIIGGFLFYFLGGYLLYSALFGAIGSAVDAETDTQQFILPITLPLLLAYLIAFMMIANPDSPIGFWGSIIPFTSPIVMVVRMAIGIPAEDMWQVYLSMFLLIVTFFGTIWVAGRIYRVGILMYGKKISYKELGKWVRMK